MADPRKVWQCVGCGRIEDSQPCVGICRDERVEYVLAAEHEAELTRLRGDVDCLREIVHRIALVTPRAGEWERTYRALQALARTAVEATAQPAGD